VSGIEFQMAVFIVGPRADISSRQRLGKEDQIDERTFSEAIWKSVKGTRSQMPARRHLLPVLPPTDGD
jgi:hypothetical protein